MGTYKAEHNNQNLDNPSIPEPTYKEQKQASTEKSVDLAGEAALDYFTGGQGSAIKDMAEKVPGAGKIVKNTWDGAVKDVSKVVSKTPAGDILKKADDAGITDAARTVKDGMNITKGGGAAATNAGKTGNIANAGSNAGKTTSALNPAKAAGANSNSSKIASNIRKDGAVPKGAGSNSNSLSRSNNSLNSDSKSPFKNLFNSDSSGPISDNIMGNIWQKMPTGLKIKIILIGGGAFLLFLIVFAAIANKDNQNLSLTNNTEITSNQSNQTGSTEVGEAAGIELSERMKWLFPNGTPSSEAEMQKYLTEITVPATDLSGNSYELKLTVHEKIASEVSAVFNELKEINFPIAKDTYAYSWRGMASSSKSRSHHSYGVAIDLNANSNPAVYWGRRPNPNDPYFNNSQVVGIWHNHGFYWGGYWSTNYYDPMHFSYTNH